MTDWKDKQGNEYVNITEDVEWADTRKHLAEVIAKLKPHFGERVVVWGGGGPGVSIATLTDATIERCLLKAHPRKVSLRVCLENETPELTYSDNHKRDPWIGSWQIAVRVINV